MTIDAVPTDAVRTDGVTTTAPWMPPGDKVTLTGGRELFVRDSGGPGPALVLVHGWMATADLNFGFAYASLAERFRVIAFDQRGHGRGLRASGNFTLARCADDVVAVLDALDVGSAFVAGYSMGGPIALNVARRAPERTAGLVLCATAGTFGSSPTTKVLLAPLGVAAGIAGHLPDSPLRRAARRRFISRRATGLHSRWIADELAPSEPSALAQAGVALARFDAFDWCSTLGVRSVSVVTVDDELVRPTSQRRLAAAVGADEVFETTGGHTACFDHPDRFNPILTAACLAVAE